MMLSIENNSGKGNLMKIIHKMESAVGDNKFFLVKRFMYYIFHVIVFYTGLKPPKVI